jgi:N-acetylmuramoyl-L-alanine amidase
MGTKLRPRFIIIHHSATKDGATFSWSAIREYHVHTKEWVDIGYHFGVEQVGDGYEVMLGRMPDEEGAHTKELAMNQLGFGVCLVGNFDTEAPADAALVKLRDVVRWLMRAYEIPTRNILGHREIGLRAGFDWEKGQYKSCPGKLFSMEDFRASL